MGTKTGPIGVAKTDIALKAVYDMPCIAHD